MAPQIEASLTRLQMDYTDLFVFHNLSTLEAWSRITLPGGGMEQLDTPSMLARRDSKGFLAIALTYWQPPFRQGSWMW